MATHSSILPGEFPRTEEPGRLQSMGCKELDVTERLILILLTGFEVFPGEGNGTLLQYFCLENPMDRGARRATVHRAIKSQTGQCDWACTYLFHPCPL